MQTTPILASSIYETAKEMEYPYIGGDYPKEITLNYAELRTILSKPKKFTQISQTSQINHEEKSVQSMQSVRKKISENIHTESVQEYLNMDKITLVKMLLASKEENKKLHDKLDKLREEAQEREAKAEEREAKAEARNEELMRANRRQMEYQVKLMDQLTEMQRQLNKTNDQYADLLVELKRQKDLNKQARKDKYDTTKQDVDRDGNDENNDDEQRGDRVQQSEDFNGDPETLMDSCNDVSSGVKEERKPSEPREYRQGMKYDKGVRTRIYYHGFDRSRLPEGSIVMKRKTRRLKSIRMVTDVHEYEWLKVRFPDGRIKWLYLPESSEASEKADEEYTSHREYRAFANTELTSDSIPTLAYLRYGLSMPSSRLSEMLRESGLGGCRQTVVNWLQSAGRQLSCLLPSLKDRLLAEGANVNCDETWSRLRLKYRSGYRKVYVWCMVNRKARTAYYFFDHPKEGTRSREVLKQFLGDAKIKSLQSDGYVGYVFLDDCLVPVDHIYCLAHVRARFVTAYDIGGVREAKPFIDRIGELYRLESYYRKLGLPPEEIRKRRNNEETSGIIREMRKELDRLWPEDKERQSDVDPIFATALRYLHNQWDGLMNYRKDGEYSIDNNISREKRASCLCGAEELAVICQRGRYRVLGDLSYHHTDLPYDGHRSIKVLPGLLQEV